MPGKALNLADYDPAGLYIFWLGQWGEKMLVTCVLAGNVSPEAYGILSPGGLFQGLLRLLGKSGFAGYCGWYVDGPK